MISNFVRGVTTSALAFAAFTGVFGQTVSYPAASVSGRTVNQQAAGAQFQGGASFQSGVPTQSSVSGSMLDRRSLQASAMFMGQSNVLIPSDNSINEDEYIIGAGDVFFITAIESQSIKFTAAVDQSGKAFIQNVGVINVGKVSYAEAKKNIAEQISSIMKNPSEIYVTLVQTKNAVISITGNIAFPGSYDLPGITRLFDAVLNANSGEMPNAADVDLRQVKLTHGDTVRTYDLLAYLHNSDETQNPYIYPGDRIRINPTAGKVFISGAVKTPPHGYYPIKDGETIREFLSMFTFDNVADRENILIYKTVDNVSITLSDADLDLVLNDLDAITVPVKKNFPGIHTVFIAGEVASPGHYPIIENTTTAKQLIDMAGGMKPTAFPDQAVVIRPVKNLPDHFNAGMQPAMSTVRPERGSSIGIASSSLDYTIIRLILYNADKVVLEPGDQIFIPKREKYVYISGAVKNPGAYPFAMGKDCHYYVKQAGGYSGNADKPNIQVFLKYGHVVQSVQPLCIEPGSVIVVPTSVQYKFLSQVILPLISAVTATISLGLAIYLNTR